MVKTNLILLPEWHIHWQHSLARQSSTTRQCSPSSFAWAHSCGTCAAQHCCQQGSTTSALQALSLRHATAPSPQWLVVQSLSQQTCSSADMYFPRSVWHAQSSATSLHMGSWSDGRHTNNVANLLPTSHFCKLQLVSDDLKPFGSLATW